MKNTDVLTKEQDVKNLEKIDDAWKHGRIDGDARDYLRNLYSDGMNEFRQIFYFLGRMLGAPKTQIYKYDPMTDQIADKEIQISEVGPLSTYLVYHRFDNDPMRNQFFTFDGGIDVRLFVSSIVSVIVAAQKNVSRAIDKITGKYYEDYIDDVMVALEKVLSKHGKASGILAISDKIRERFHSQFTSQAAPEVLKIIGGMFPSISVDLVRELDKITPPHARLADVYRMKMLFDTVPQINAFIDFIRRDYGDKFLLVKNKFYDLENDRSYRDAKIVMNIGAHGAIVPLEVICNVRTFFDFERLSHQEYETIRSKKSAANKAVSELHHKGIVQYNKIICQAVQYLMQRVGWNIMYEKDLGTDSFFRGFPKIDRLPYSPKIVEVILDKIENNVRNEVFVLSSMPRELSEQEEIAVFRYMTQFILFAALPYSWKYDEIKNMGFAGKLFNFVMKELYRYYENDVL